MKVNVVETSPCGRTLEVTVEPERVEEAFERAFRQACKILAIPGFRKGKVPPALARRHIRDRSLSSQVVEDLVPRSYVEALEQVDLTPVSEVKWEVGDLERGRELSFSASFEVKPHVELTGYRGMEITQARPEVTEGTVQATLDEVRLGHSKLVTVEEDRGLVEGDMARVDFEGSLDGSPLPRGSATNYLMQVTPGSFVAGFIENLIGMRAGEEKEFEVTFPEDYAAAELAGRPVHFRFKLHEIKARQLPEADDAFAREASEFETLDALKASIRKRLEEEIQHEAEHGAANQIFRKLAEQVSQEQIPPALVIARARQYHAQVMGDLERSGKTLQEVLQAQGMDPDQWQNHALGMGFGEARMEIMIESLARQEGVAVAEEEIDAHLEQQAARAGQTKGMIRKRWQEDGTLEHLKAHLLRHKVMHVAVDAASITWVEPEVAAATEAGQDAEVDEVGQEAAAAAGS